MFPPPYVGLYPADFLADVVDLGNTELGIYWRLTLLYYQARRPLPRDRDKLTRMALALTPEEVRALDYVLERYFVAGTDSQGGDSVMVWRHERIDREIQAAQTRWDKASEHARQAANARWNARALPQQCPSNANQNQNQKKIKTNTHAGEVSPETPRTDVPYAKIISLYHETLPELRTWQKLTEARRRSMHARWKSGDLPTLEAWKAYFLQVRRSPFLMGRYTPATGQAFQADLEWLFKGGNFAKVQEGKYLERKSNMPAL